jgi:hypothetical protein
MTVNNFRIASAQWLRIAPWVMALLPTMSLAASHPGHVQFDAARLRTGTFTYRDTLAGGSPHLSTSRITRLSDGSYRFIAEIPAFDQSWSTTASRALTPLATQLEMRTRQGQHYKLVLSYAQRKVTGRVVIDPSSNDGSAGSDSAVTGYITADTVDQRIDWAAVMSTDRRPGESFDFQVYDAKTGLSQVHSRVSDAGLMDTPAGKVHAIRINYSVHKSTGTETYVVYATATMPRMMLREELRGNLVITLVGIHRPS